MKELDMGLDPFTLEALSMEERKQKALADLLRKPKQGQVVSGILVGGEGPGDAFMDSYNKSKAKKELDSLPGQRKALGERYQQTLVEALRGGTPESLVSHPATRSMGLSLSQKQLEMKMAEDEMARIQGGGGGGSALPMSTGQVPPYDAVVSMTMSSNPTVAARGKALMDAYYKAQDPKNMVTRGAGGVAVPIPGALDAYKSQQNADEEAKANFDLVDVPDGRGGTIRMPRSQAVAALGGRPSSPGATPSPSPNPASAGPSGAAAMAPAPIGANPGDPGELSAWGGPEGLKLAFEMATKRGDMRTAAHLAGVGRRANIALETQMPLQEGQRREMAASADYTSNIPRAVGPQPPSKLGATPPKSELESKAQDTKLDTTVLREFPVQMQRLSELEKFVEAPSGAKALILKSLDYAAPLWGSRGIEGAAQARAFQAQVGALIGDILKTYGYNPSNVDLRAAASRLPTVEDSPAARQEVLNLVRRGLVFEHEQAQRRMGAIPAQPAAGPTVNPTEPGAATPSPGKSVQTLPQGAGEDGFADDLRRSVVNLLDPSTLASKAEGAYDAWGNVVRGVGQILPGKAYTEEEWVKEKARQEAKGEADPGYNQGRIFGSIANPTALLGAGTGSVLKATLSSMLSGLIQPASTAEERAFNTVSSGVIGGGSTVAAKVLPATALPKSMEAGEGVRQKFKDVPLTGAQMNPRDIMSRLGEWFGVNERAAPEQAKVLTKTLLRSTGSTADTVSREVLENQAKVLAQGYERVLPKTLSAKVGSVESAALHEAIKRAPQVEDLMAKAPKLAAVYNALRAAGSNGQRIRVRDLHEAWKEIGTVAGHNRSQAAGEIRNLLENVIGRGLGPQGLKEFKQLNKQWGNLEDLRNIYSGGAGLGIGESASYFRPSRIVEEGGRNPVLGSSTQDAIEFIQRFGIRDAHVPGYHPFDLSRPGTWGHVPGASAIASGLDYNLINSPNMIKKLIESLRVGARVGPRETAEYGRE